VTTPHDAERIQEVRRVSKFLITIGACATAGGIQALRNFKDVKEFLAIVYAKPEYISTLEKSTPIAEHVRVDFELRGCPVNKYQLLEVVNAFVNGRKPNTPTYSVCVECKAARDAVRDGGPRHAVPGAGHPGGLWRDLPGVPPRGATAVLAPKRRQTPRR
jgi:coenzyme F420-reducing hydrogenase gamma subunit